MIEKSALIVCWRLVFDVGDGEMVVDGLRRLGCGCRRFGRVVKDLLGGVWISAG